MADRFGPLSDNAVYRSRALELRLLVVSAVLTFALNRLYRRKPEMESP
jgi:hypothetical protein